MFSCADACELTLDPNTVHTSVSLSADKRKVPGVKEQQPYPDHPERFDVCKQVLNVESLTGRCYWEAEFSGKSEKWTGIAVTYRGIRRKGDSSVCGFGYNKQSWNCSGIVLL